MTELDRLRDENRRLRKQFVGVVQSVLAGCTGVTIASNDGREPPPRSSKLVHRCLLEQRLQDALQSQLTDYPGPTEPEGTE